MIAFLGSTPDHESLGDHLVFARFLEANYYPRQNLTYRDVDRATSMTSTPEYVDVMTACRDWLKYVSLFGPKTIVATVDRHYKILEDVTVLWYL